jgi:hypothetical protein
MRHEERSGKATKRSEEALEPKLFAWLGDAVIYAALGDKIQAMTWLEKGNEERFNPSVLLRPDFDPLRSDPRFQELVRRIGLPAQTK